MVTLEQAVKEVRRTLEASYQGLCTIVEYHDVTDPKTKLSKEKEVVITENQPCKLSFRSCSDRNCCRCFSERYIIFSAGDSCKKQFQNYCCSK